MPVCLDIAGATSYTTHPFIGATISAPHPLSLHVRQVECVITYHYRTKQRDKT